MSGHTPGPWMIRRKGGNCSNAIEAYCGGKLDGMMDDGIRVLAMYQPCTFSRMHEEQESNAMANARLIAAAPELLDALKELTAMVNRQKDFNDDHDGETIDRCQAAVAKAEGKQ